MPRTRNSQKTIDFKVKKATRRSSRVKLHTDIENVSQENISPRKRENDICSKLKGVDCSPSKLRKLQDTRLEHSPRVVLKRDHSLTRLPLSPLRSPNSQQKANSASRCLFGSPKAVRALQFSVDTSCKSVTPIKDTHKIVVGKHLTFPESDENVNSKIETAVRCSPRQPTSQVKKVEREPKVVSCSAEQSIVQCLSSNKSPNRSSSPRATNLQQRIPEVFKTPERNFSPCRSGKDLPGKQLQSPVRSSPRLSRQTVSPKTKATPSKSGKSEPCGKNMKSPIRSSPRKLTAASRLGWQNETPQKQSDEKCLVFSPEAGLRNRSSKKLLLSPVRSSPRKTTQVARLAEQQKTPQKQVGQRCLAFSPDRLMTESPCKKVLMSPVRCSPRKLPSALRLAHQESLSYQKAKQALHTALPEKLMGRDKEYNTVNTFIDTCVSKATAGSLYISGAPGTGKTAVLSHTLRRLEDERICQVVYINCMSMRNSQAIYSKVLNEVSGKQVTGSVKQTAKLLEKSFTTITSPVVLILDEIDQLDSKNQEILYTMFEWPALPKSRVILIGIANALDLTDRILPRLQALPKCKPKLLNFSPYSKEQIVAVLKSRLEEMEVNGEQVLEPGAIQFCARKVAAVAGDMRKALDVCRRAVETVEGEVKKQQILQRAGMATSNTPIVGKKIGVPHIMRIMNEVYGTRVTVQPGQQQTVPLQQKLATCTLLLMLKQGKAKEVPLGKFHETYCKICQRQNVASIDQSEFLSLCTLIEARGIMGLKRTKETRTTKVCLKLDEREFESALQDKTLVSSIMKAGLPAKK